MALVVFLLVAGLGGLLFLHTALAEDSFRLHDLQVRSVLLTDQLQTLDQSVAAQASPEQLSAQARALGMVRSQNPAFLRLADGRILGKPKAAVAPPPPAPPPPPTVQKPNKHDGKKKQSGPPDKTKATDKKKASDRPTDRKRERP